MSSTLLRFQILIAWYREDLRCSAPEHQGVPGIMRMKGDGVTGTSFDSVGMTSDVLRQNINASRYSCEIRS